MKKKLFISVFIMCLIILGLFINITPKEEKLEEIKDEKMLAIYVEGVYTDEFPSTENLYKTSVKCYDSSNNLLNTTSKVVKDGDKWKVQVSNLTTSAKCNVYFDEPMPDGWKDAPEGSLLAGIKENYPKAGEPWTWPGRKTSSNGYADHTFTLSLSSSANQKYQGYYWTYGDDYEIDENGDINLVGVHTILFNDTEGDNYSVLVDKYLVSPSAAASNCSETNEAVSTTRLSGVYQVTDASLTKVSFKRLMMSISVDSRYQDYWWTYGQGIKHRTDNNSGYELIGATTLKFSQDYSKLVGKYLVTFNITDPVYSHYSNDTNTLKATYNTYYFLVTYADSDNLIVSMPREALLAYDEDDTGISYYFRGMVENNYLIFANMCWRIVRIDGSGNIKLVLYNYNANYNDSSVTNPCASTYNSTSAAFARYNSTRNGLAGKSAFNSLRNKNTYIGFMYSNNPDSTDFDTAHANDNPSTILTNLMSWYNTYLRTPGYDTKLADVIWCNDKSFGTLTNTGTGVGNSTTRHGAYDRLSPISTAKPSLICPDAGYATSDLSKFTASPNNGNGALTISDQDYKVGLLTADEVAFTGGIYQTFGNSYLKENATSMNWWLMSPGSSGSSSTMTFIGSTGTLQISGNLTNAYGLRPSVALKADTSITTASETNKGTAENPYIVQ